MLASAWSAIEDWATAVFGNWPNATQGSVGAFASVAAALLVVGLTRRHERKLALEGEARRAVASLLSALRQSLQTFLSADFERLDIALLDIGMLTTETAAIVERVSPSTAQRLLDSSTVLVDLAGSDGQVKEASFFQAIEPLHDVCHDWLSGKAVGSKWWTRRSAS
jgi:hypothetical protein